jgi:hypothetical protein
VAVGDDVLAVSTPYTGDMRMVDQAAVTSGPAFVSGRLYGFQAVELDPPRMPGIRLQLADQESSSRHGANSRHGHQAAIEILTKKGLGLHVSSSGVLSRGCDLYTTTPRRRTSIILEDRSAPIHPLDCPERADNPSLAMTVPVTNHFPDGTLRCAEQLDETDKTPK